MNSRPSTACRSCRWCCAEGADGKALNIADGALCRGRRHRELRLPGRARRRGREGQGDCAPRGDGRRQGHHAISPARLAGFPPALLGLPDPGDPLRKVRRRAGAGEGPAGRSCRTTSTFDRPGNPLDRHPTWKNVDCPTCGGRRTARDRHVRHLHRSGAGTSTGSPRRSSRRRRSTAKRTSTGCRSINISAASSTRSCTCSIRASGRAPCARSR